MSAISATVTGNLTDNPELRYTPSGAPVATFSVAVNERMKDNSTGEWKDGPTSYVRVVAWRELGEHVAESLRRGDRAIVTGTFRERSYTVDPTREGDSGNRRVWELTAAEVGAGLRYATVKVSKATRTGAVPPPDSDPWQDVPAPDDSGRGDN